MSRFDKYMKGFSDLLLFAGACGLRKWNSIPQLWSGGLDKKRIKPHIKD